MPSNHNDSVRVSPDTSEILLALVDHLDAMVAYWDLNQVCVFANNAYYSWFGKRRADMIGITMQELLGPLYPQNLPYILAAYRGQTQVFERAIPTPDGAIRFSLATYTPNIVDGQVIGIFVHVADVTSLKKMEQELLAAKERAEKIATHDFLTGLLNRVPLVEGINQAIARAERNNEKIAVISVDMDNFKQVNDKCGHGEGDRLLVEIASRFKSLLRKSDTIARMGGDEFLILAPEIASVDQAEAFIHRILTEVSRPFFITDFTEFISFSAGIALYPEAGTTPELLISASDRAMYVAKKLGKNRYIFADRATSPPSSSAYIPKVDFAL